MALLEEQFTEKLQAGASPITYEGNEGREQQIAQALWDKLPPQARMQFGSFAQFFSSGAWKKVLAALQQQMRQGPEEEIQETETETVGQAPQAGLGALMQGPRPMAGGGIMGSNAGSMLVARTADGSRPGYGFLSKVKDFGKKLIGGVKKVAKSPIGKAALLYAGTAGLGALGAGAGRAGGWKGMFGPSNIMKNLAASKASLLGIPARGASAMPGMGQLFNPATSGILGAGGPMGKFALTKGAGSFMPTALGWGAAATAAPLVMGAMGKWAPDEQFDELKLKSQEFGFDYAQMIQDIQNAENEEEYLAVLAKYNLSTSDLPPWGSQKRAEGGRIGYQLGERVGDTPEVLGPITSGKGITDLDTGDFNLSDLGEYTQMYPSNPKETRAKIMAIVKRLIALGMPPARAIEKAAQIATSGTRGMGEEFIEESVTERNFPKDFEWPKRNVTPLPEPIRPEHPDDIYYPKTPNEGMQPYGRTRAQEGGLMDLGGMEKDYRQEGGFVPIGGKEKADDVPARLSRNEFVFTADAVRAAGGGDIDQGAEVMENVMKNLEGGGRISEESQGQGARDMFQVSERLSEVV